MISRRTAAYLFMIIACGAILSAYARSFVLRGPFTRWVGLVIVLLLLAFAVFRIHKVVR